MAKNNNNNAEMLNEFVEVLKFIRTTRQFTYDAFVEGAISIVVEYDLMLGRFIFTGYYNKSIDRNINCVSCTSISCAVHKFIEDRYPI